LRPVEAPEERHGKLNQVQLTMAGFPVAPETRVEEFRAEGLVCLAVAVYARD